MVVLGLSRWGKVGGIVVCCFDGCYVDRWKGMNVDVDEINRGFRVGVVIYCRYWGFEDSDVFRRI